MKYNACATTFFGFEEIAVQEIKELLGICAITQEGVVLFSATDEELAKLCYLSHGLKRILRLYGYFSFANLDDWSSHATKILSTQSRQTAIFATHPFRAVCHRYGSHLFSSQECAAAYGAVILAIEKKANVDLNDPKLLATAIIVQNISYIGIDFAGLDLSRREYKIYSHPATLNAGFAYCAIRFAGYSCNETLLDPLCGVGTIILEASLFAAKISPRFYRKDAFFFHYFMNINLSQFDEEVEKNVLKKISLIGYDQHLRHIESAKKMAKLAGIQKIVSFSRVDLEWLDTKLDENSVDLVVTHPPVHGNSFSEKDMEKLYKEFFYQIAYVLSKKGKIVLLCQKTDVLKRMLGDFIIINEHIAFQGKQEFTLVTLEKKCKM